MKQQFSVQEIMLGFRDFLVIAWPAFQQQLQFIPAINQEYVIDDWLQMNWEALVERAVCQYCQMLQAYGNGGDANGMSDRIVFPNARATHIITCAPKKGAYFINAFDDKPVLAEDFEWYKLVSLPEHKQHYLDAPPFDYVLLENGNDLAVVSLEEVEFSLKAI